MSSEREYVAFLSEKEQKQKDTLVANLVDSKNAVIHVMEKLNELIAELNDKTQIVHENVKKINSWMRSIHTEKSRELEEVPKEQRNFTNVTDLHCYSGKFDKIRLRLPDTFDCDSFERDVNTIIEEFDELP